MNNFEILDCTLRDGGYVNNWEFGLDKINQTISDLSNANIDIVEVGFLSRSDEFTIHQSKFNSIDILEKRINLSNSSYVAMINFGEMPIDQVPKAKLTKLFGLRIAFHKKDLVEALDYSKKVKDKGYNLFIQAMVTPNYNFDEFRELVTRANKINPYAFYIVDSFGFMTQSDLEKYYEIVKNNLNEKIKLGFHLHNNLQLAYSNALWAINEIKSHKLIIDSSLMGIGRGAGNLTTELIYAFKYNNNKDITNLIHSIEETVIPIGFAHQWGYSIGYLQSAVERVHPNYIKYLKENHNVSLIDISEILKLIPKAFRVYYNPDIIDQIVEEKHA